MKQLLLTLLVALVALASTFGDAEARRLGGGKSLGAQRLLIAPSRKVQQPAPPQKAAPTVAPNAPQPAGSRWFGPLAGLAAGLGLGWLLGQGGFGGMLGTVLLIALAAFAVSFVLRLLFQPKAQGDIRYAVAGGDPAGEAAAPSSGLGAATLFGAHPQPNIPPGFDTEGFLRQAKLNFVKLQAAHDSGRLEELREFASDEMYTSIRQELQQRANLGQQTDVVTLDADLLEALTEGDTHWASVRFSGMIRESPDAQPEPFQEIWNLAKPASGASGWVLAGIQQIQ